MLYELGFGISVVSSHARRSERSADMNLGTRMGTHLETCSCVSVLSKAVFAEVAEVLKVRVKDLSPGD